MKKLFSIKNTGFFRMEEENAVYSIFHSKENKRTFYDNNGAELPNYVRPKVEANFCDYDIDSNHEDEIKFNKYGIACGDHCLIDNDGNELPDTKLNCEEECYEENRYYSFALLNDEQCASIDKCGTAENILIDIYDTKFRRFVAKGVPECVLSLTGFDGEEEVVLAAVDLVKKYDSIFLDGKGTIIAYKDDMITVFDYYQN